MVKEKNINIHIKNTNIIKEKPKRKKRRRNKKKSSKLNKTVLGNPYQYPSNQPIMITPPHPLYSNDEAKTYAKNYLLLKNEPEEGNKNNLLLKGEENENLNIQNNNKKITIKKTPKKKTETNVYTYTYEGLMKIKTLTELRKAMKLLDPSISDSVLKKITGINKPEAIIRFLKHMNETVLKPENEEPIIPPPPPPLTIKKTQYDEEPKVNNDKNKKMKNLRELFHNKNYNTPSKQLFKDQTATTENNNINYNNAITPHTNELLESISNVNKNLKKNLQNIEEEKELQEFKYESPIKKYAGWIQMDENV